MSTTEVRYRIAEVARLTGFTATTLRFYEQAGVLAPPARTDAGYRAYTERDVERLRLIARAKELGCTLDEIAGLVQAWEDDECGPVKHRLRSLVHAKVAEVRQHIASQVAFAAQLQATAASLGDRPVDGPCDDACGCSTPSTAQPVLLVDGPAVGDRPPIACSLGASDVQGRVEEWHALLAGVVDRQPIPNGVRLVFGTPAPLAEISRLAAAEHGCCSFFAFAITVDGRGVALEATAPADAHEMLEALFGVAA